MNKPLKQAIEYAQQSVKRSGTSFYWAMRVLAPEKRLAMYALYAFCRDVDDIADEPGPTAQKRAQLDVWRTEIDAVFNNKPSRPLGWALVEPIHTFPLKRSDFMAIIDGMESDAGESVRMATMEDLNLYIDQVACAVGRLSNSIFGIQSPLRDEIAKALGEALQLTNILRDVEEDAGNDRLYLPADLLASNDVYCGQNDEVSQILSNPGTVETCHKLEVLAQQRYNQARDLLSECNDQQARPARMMLEVYERLLSKLSRRGWEFPCKAVSLTKFEKIWILLKYGLF